MYSPRCWQCNATFHRNCPICGCWKSEFSHRAPVNIAPVKLPEGQSGIIPKADALQKSLKCFLFGHKWRRLTPRHPSLMSSHRVACILECDRCHLVSELWWPSCADQKSRDLINTIRTVKSLSVKMVLVMAKESGIRVS